MRLTGTVHPDRPLLVVALDEEAAQLGDSLPVLITGVGKVRAATAVARLLATEAPAYVVNIGTAGGLRHGLDGVHEIGTVIQHDFASAAIEAVTGIIVKLRDYQIASVSTGEDAQGEVSIEVEHPTGVYRGRALSTDIIEGSARAFLDVVNRIALKAAPAEAARAELGSP